jgi:protein-tyrosine phosphatase
LIVPPRSFARGLAKNSKKRFQSNSGRNPCENRMPDFQFVTERLAVGSAIGTFENMLEVSAAGITHVVNLQAEFDDRSIVGDTGVEVLWIECSDDFLPKPAELFWDGILFTLEALRDPRARVLVHCAAGIHRSPMMLFAMLRVLGHQPEEARNLIAAARPLAEFPSVYLDSVEDFVRQYLAAEEAELLDRDHG